MGQSSWPPEDLLKGIQGVVKSIQMENQPEAKLIPFPLSPLKTKALGAKPKVKNVNLNSQDQASPQADCTEQHHRGETSEILESLPEDDLPGEENTEEIPRGAQGSSQPPGLETQIQNGDSSESDRGSQSEEEESDVEIQDLERNFNRLRLTPPAQAIGIRLVPAKGQNLTDMEEIEPRFKRLGIDPEEPLPRRRRYQKKMKKDQIEPAEKLISWEDVKKLTTQASRIL
ncbi:hypothetical protein H1C71_000819 [Ictidomys tridecemlineatus]|nr:hypothetical protein H1C71_000819 [Ictidomys tridecemlineatus]